MYNVGLIILLFTWAASYYLMTRARTTGKAPYIRSIAAFDAIEELVGRATEMGRPVHLTTGHGGRGLYTDRAAYHMAGLSILGYVSEKCATMNTDLICSVGFAEMIPIAEDIIQQGYTIAGHPELFEREMVRFHVDNWHTFALYTMATVQEENVAANIMVGNLDCTTGAIIAAGALQTGAMQIGGAGSSTWALATFIAFCDYVLMGEEVPIAGAKITGDIEGLASLVGSDYAKVLVVLLMIAGIIANVAGISSSWLVS